MKRYFLLLAIIPSFIFAKNNGDSIKFEIIKAAINFYTTDNSYKALKGKLLTCDNIDYGCINDYCKDNNVSSIRTKVDNWKSLPSKSPEDLKKISDKIIVDLLLKKERETSDDFKAFKKKAKELQELYSDRKTSSTPATPPSVIEGSSTGLPQTPAPEDNSKPKSESKLPFIALLIGIGALTLSIINFIRNKGIGKPNSVTEKSSLDYHSLIEDIKELKSRVTQKQGIELKPLEDKIKNLEGRILNIENQPKVIEMQVSNQLNNPEISKSQLQTNNTKFARYPDLSNGFTNSSLKDNQNGEHIYQITIAGDNATFTIADDINAQIFALSDYKNYLMDACDFLNQPFKNCRINTVNRGTLSKSSNDWIIQTKAKIEFK